MLATLAAPDCRPQDRPAASTWGQVNPAPLRVSFKQAVELALGDEGNALVRIADESINQAQARSRQTRSALLPSLDASVVHQSQTRNLAAFGIDIQIPIPGYVSPTFVGPFTVFDARATASQTVFNMKAIRAYQASRAGVRLAEAETESVRDQIRARVAKAYLDGLRSRASVEAAQTNVALSEALLELAESQKEAGVGTGIEVTRARVQLANDRQKFLAAQNDRTRAHLQLLKFMGLSLDTAIELGEPMSYVPVPSMTPAQALRTALDSRTDWKAQERRVESARLSLSAERMERIPSLSLFADYGTIGPSINDAIPTRSYGFAVRLPLFDGGAREARQAEYSSQLRQERIRAEDLRRQIELEIRTALDNLQSADIQVEAAEEGLALAQDEIAQARRRYQAGVTTNLEVTDAQTRLARARENRIAALFNYNLARIDLSTAMGTIRQMTR